MSIGRHSVFYNNWYRKGVKIVNDLLKHTSPVTFYSYNEFIHKYGVVTNFLQFQGIVNVVKQNIDIQSIQDTKLILPYIPFNIEPFINKTKGTKHLYKVLSKNDEIPTGRKKWTNHYDFDDSVWGNIFYLPFKITNDSKLQWFQYRILHNILTTNSLMFKANIVSSPLCTFCNSESETITHIFWDCQKVQDLLQSLEILLDALLIPFTINKHSFIFGLPSVRNVYNKVDNEISIIIKHYIYKTRCLNTTLNLKALINSIRENHNVKKYTATGKGEASLEYFNKGWEKWKRVLLL